MSELRDDLDSWLDEPVRPLPPQPGAFERIRRRARRRKMLRAAASAAAATVVLVSAAVVPRLAVHHFSPDTRMATGLPGKVAHRQISPHPAARPPSPRSHSHGPGKLTDPTLIRPRAGSGVSSVTFVGKTTGWVLGQARAARRCASTCTAVARTNDRGRTWQGVNPPPAGAPSGADGVSQIRFLDGTNGWAFGPGLWATHDSGRHWSKVRTGGRRVIALETLDGRAFAVWGVCYGSGSAYTTSCSRFFLFTSPAASDQWQKVPGPALATGGGGGSVAMALSASRVYLLGPGREMVTAAVSSPARLTVVTHHGSPASAPCGPGRPEADGQPTGALIAATGKAPQLILMCLGQPAGGTQAKQLYYSSNGGAQWTGAGGAPAAGVAESLSGSPSCGAVLATSRGIDMTAIIGKEMHGTLGIQPRGGFTYVGMTTSRQGVAVPADRSLHSVWFSYDSGLTWVRHPVSLRPG